MFISWWCFSAYESYSTVKLRWALRERLKGYEGGDDSDDCAHGERAAEDTEENADGFEKGRSIKRVCVCADGLVGHDRAEKTTIHINQ